MKINPRDVQILEMRFGLGHRIKYISKIFNLSESMVKAIFRKYKPKFNNPEILVIESKINGDN